MWRRVSPGYYTNGDKTIVCFEDGWYYFQEGEGWTGPFKTLKEAKEGAERKVTT